MGVHLWLLVVPSRLAWVSLDTCTDRCLSLREQGTRDVKWDIPKFSLIRGWGWGIRMVQERVYISHIGYSNPIWYVNISNITPLYMQSSQIVLLSSDHWLTSEPIKQTAKLIQALGMHKCLDWSSSWYFMMAIRTKLLNCVYVSCLIIKWNFILVLWILWV